VFLVINLASAKSGSLIDLLCWLPIPMKKQTAKNYTFNKNENIGLSIQYNFDIKK